MPQLTSSKTRSYECMSCMPYTALDRTSPYITPSGRSWEVIPTVRNMPHIYTSVTGMSHER